MEKYLLILLLLYGCRGSPVNISGSFDPAILPYYYSFLMDAEKYNVDVSAGDNLVSLEFGNPGYSEDKDIYGNNIELLGICSEIAFLAMKNHNPFHNSEIKWKKVIIKRPYNNNFDARFKMLVYHELGHCLLLKDHDPNQNSIMHATIVLSNDEIELNWDDYARDLFLGKTRVDFEPDRPLHPDSTFQ